MVTDRSLLQWALWEQSDDYGLVDFTQQELADQLGVSRGRASQVVAEMLAEGRLVKQTPRGRYRVVSPVGFELEPES